MEIYAITLTRRSFGITRRSLELADYTILGQRYVDSARRSDAFRTVEICEFEAAVVDSGNLVGNLILKVGILVKLNTSGKIFTYIENASYLPGLVRNRNGIVVTSRVNPTLSDAFEMLLRADF